MVKATKRSLCYLPTSTLSLLEFDAAIKNIASTINNHPLGLNVSRDEVLTPNQLLLGRFYDPVHNSSISPSGKWVILTSR